MTSREFRDRLRRRARRADLALDDRTIQQLETYYSLLARWNSKINLTALPVARLEDEALDRLLIEPLVAATHVEAGPAAAIDIGSGAGSPAIPMAIARPELQVRMVESKTRKAVFLLEAVRALELNAVVETARFEALLSRPELHEAADLLTIRAVRVELRTLLSLQAFIRPDGRVFWFRSSAGPSVPEVPPPLRWTMTAPLVDTLGSRLIILQKSRVA